MASSTSYVLDRGSNGDARLLRLPPGARAPRIVPGMDAARGLTVDGAGVLYAIAVDPRYLTLSIVTLYPDGHRRQLPLAGTAVDYATSLAIGPMAIDGHGALYCADGQQVLKIAPNGHVATAPAPLPTRIVGSDAKITGLAVSRAGTLYVTVSSMSSTGEDQAAMLPAGGRPSTIATGLSEAGGIAVDAHGAVYIADSGNDRVVEALPPH